MKFLGKIKNTSGQTIMEYVIITSLIGIVSLTVVQGFGNKLKTKIERLESKINSRIGSDVN